MTDDQPKRSRGQRGPGRKPKMEGFISIRLPQHVYDHFDGSSTAMRMVLTAWVEGRLTSREGVSHDDVQTETGR